MAIILVDKKVKGQSSPEKNAYSLILIKAVTFTIKKYINMLKIRPFFKTPIHNYCMFHLEVKYEPNF